MLPVLIYAGISSLTTYILYKKGKFENVNKSKYAVVTALGFILLFVDIIETWVAFEYEGNLILLLIPREYLWQIFISFHIVGSVILLWLGKKGMMKENISHRAILTFATVYLILLTVMNAVLYPLNLSL